MISPERVVTMQGQWVRLLSGFGVSIAEAYPPFDRLVEAYSEPHRHYHTLEHLGEMFRVVGRLANQCKDLAAVNLAVWYHDAVYDAKAKDNEEQSTARAEKELKALGIPEATRQAVRELILATKHSATSPTSPDAIVLLDADLAILGAADNRYSRYTRDIRREYDWVPEPEYRVGRREVLEGFLKRERIYQTPLLSEEGEAAARKNLQWELETLLYEANTGPT